MTSGSLVEFIHDWVKSEKGYPIPRKAVLDAMSDNRIEERGAAFTIISESQNLIYVHPKIGISDVFDFYCTQIEQCFFAGLWE